MRLELTRVGLLVELANHYTTRGALDTPNIVYNLVLEIQVVTLTPSCVVYCPSLRHIGIGKKKNLSADPHP